MCGCKIKVRGWRACKMPCYKRFGHGPLAEKAWGFVSMEVTQVRIP